MSIAEDKQRLRQQARARRAETNASLGKSAGAAIQAQFEKSIRVPSLAVIGGYWPMRSEMDVVPLLTALQKKGHRIVLPVVEGDAPLTFRPWKPGVAMESGPGGTLHPTATAGSATPTVLLVPLLAFDSVGQRLGNGGGHYDRTIAQLREGGGTPLVIGLAFSSQRVEKLPAEPHDQKLDWVVTERGATKFTP